jgi:membrane associated rhomboid family serine protease
MAEPRYCYRHPDRETGLSCSDCGRPICVDCMTVAPVGIRCPDHAGTRPRAVTAATKPATVATKRVRRTAARRGYVIPEFSVTRVLVIVNVAIYFLELAKGGDINGTGNSIYENGALYGPLVAQGDWWRLFTAAFLHYGPVHLGLNMLALWWLGQPVEAALGRWRYLLLYVVAGLAGSAGALLLNPTSVTVGASGAIFGILGALLVLEYQVTGSLAGQAMTLIVINVAFSFAVAGISIGGHLGGLTAGILGTIALVGFRNYYPVVGRPALVRAAIVVGIGVLSVLIAYLKVRQYA